MNISALQVLAFIDKVWFYIRRKKTGGGRASSPGVSIHSRSHLSSQIVDGIFWPDFPTIAHSLWRAQEVTLFRTCGVPFREPTLDLGCGDGLFGDIAGFPAPTIGFDCDEPSLAVRRHLFPESESVCGDARRLPFSNGTFETVLSNSVFEHLPDLQICMNEMYRVLRPGGKLLFTMTLGEFTEHLRRLTGLADADLWVRSFGHNQEPSSAEVRSMLSATGFKVMEFREYQPVELTQTYRMLVSPAYQYLERRGAFNRAKTIERLSPLVTSSITGCAASKGACAWVHAEK